MKTNTTKFWRLAVDYGAIQAGGIRHITRGSNNYAARETTKQITYVGGRPS